MRGHSSRSARVRRPAPVLWLCCAWLLFCAAGSIYNRLSGIRLIEAVWREIHDSYGNLAKSCSEQKLSKLRASGMLDTRNKQGIDMKSFEYLSVRYGPPPGRGTVRVRAAICIQIIHHTLPAFKN